MSTDFLDLDELYDVHKKQDSNRMQIFREIYRKCLAKMKHTNNILRRMECNFQVPTFVWGIPIYDYEELKDYILFHLNENGLSHCYFIDATTLYMSWKPEHIDKKKYQTAKKKTFSTTNVETPTISSNITSNSKSNDNSKPSSTMMKFDNIFEVPVNLEKINMVNNTNLLDGSNVSPTMSRLKTLSKVNPSRNPPSRQLMDSWKNYFDKKLPK